ncbi:unnamed protein product [Larinioides sclopetarius]|uniref:Uncharacterized protein n=1 Tax=Larinioides sclopetarius TaxID=280406 RepID=A0AAV2A4N6_9ARAC
MFPLDFLEDLILDIRFQSLIGLFFLIRWAWRSPGPRREANNKAVFITGCDSGMGHRMARRFDEMGMQVFAGCLQPAGKGALGLKRVCSDRLHIVPIDITNDQQVREAVTYVEANLPPGEKGLYCLVNNAGVLAYTDFELMTPKMCEEVLSINLMGTIRVTKHFLPLISRSPVDPAPSGGNLEQYVSGKAKVQVAFIRENEAEGDQDQMLRSRAGKKLQVLASRC